MSLGSLSAEQVERYRAEGYLSPVAALSASEAESARASLDALMVRTGGLTDAGLRHKPHLHSKWVSDLVRHPRVLDAVESILGPDLLVWRSIFFVKPARDPRYIAWHQDSAYWGLSSDEEVTAWIALTPSTRENGCLRVVPGSHRKPAIPHALRFDRHNILVRGQDAVIEVGEGEARSLELRPGEMSLHHVRMLHGSEGNASDEPRVGLAVRYISTRVSQRGFRQSSTLVRGEDRFGHFDLEPAPRWDADPESLRWHRRSRRRYAVEVLFETFFRSFPGNLAGMARLITRPARLRLALRSLWGSITGRGSKL